METMRVRRVSNGVDPEVLRLLRAVEETVLYRLRECDRLRPPGAGVPDCGRLLHRLTAAQPGLGLDHHGVGRIVAGLLPEYGSDDGSHVLGAHARDQHRDRAAAA